MSRTAPFQSNHPKPAPVPAPQPNPQMQAVQVAHLASPANHRIDLRNAAGQPTGASAYELMERILSGEGRMG